MPYSSAILKVFSTIVDITFLSCPGSLNGTMASWKKGKLNSLPTGLGFASFFKNKFIYFWLRWVFIAVRRLSLLVASGL